MKYIVILIGGIAGFLYWNFIGCDSGTCPITSNKYITVTYGAALGSLLFSFIGDSLKGKSSHYKDIDHEEMKALRENPSDKNYIVIDVRTPAEWNQGYIPETDLFIDLSSADFKDEIKKLDISKSYILYCRSGNRSKMACLHMHSKGFTKLFNLSGGIKEWKGELKRT